MEDEKHVQRDRMNSYLCDSGSERASQRGKTHTAEGDASGKFKAGRKTAVTSNLTRQPNDALGSTMTRRPYRDIEGEMEDYAPVGEDMYEEDSDGYIEDTAALPKPVYGQIAKLLANGGR